MKDKEVKKSKAATEDEDYEDPVEEGGEEETEEESGTEEDEDDFRARAKKNLKKAGSGKSVKTVGTKAGKPSTKGDKKVKTAKKSHGANTSNGVSRKEWNTPWRPSSVLAQAFEMVDGKNIPIKELTAFAKKNNVEPDYVIGAMKRKKTRNWKWETKVSETHIKVFNAHAGSAKKAA
jgi:hypothetical protein